MTIRNAITAPQNIFFNTQNVDDTDLALEQNFNSTIQSGIIANNIGYGVIPGSLLPNILFDSSLSATFLDGVAVLPQSQPSDPNLGNQLAITLTGSAVGGKRTVKVCVIGLDFQSNLQYETFVFRTNETQVSYKHFTSILTLLFNDLQGDPTYSLNLGGTLVIQEASSMMLSRDPEMVAQGVQPNLFFRDFFVERTSNPSFDVAWLQSQNPLLAYDISSLNIQTTELGQQILYANDVTTQIGEKFLALTNNIQKVTLLLSVQNTAYGQSSNLVWTGDLICSIYPLQSSVECPTDIAPTTPIYFSPSNIPIAQISFDYDSLAAIGYKLDSVPQPIDFVFSNNQISTGNYLTPGSYYAVTLKRAGADNTCDILLATGSPTTPNSLLTVFTGDIWTDLPDQQLWFQVWTDSAKVSDGQAYENGHGVAIPKTNTDPTTNATVDYVLDDIQFTGNEVFEAVLSAITVASDPIPDQRTGEPVDSRQQFEPQVQLLNPLDIANLEKASEPLLLGAIQDKNIKSLNVGSTTTNANLYGATMVGDELLIPVVIDGYYLDNTTPNPRFDQSVIDLQSDLLNGYFNEAMITVNANSYRVADARICTYIMGDVDGNGIVDENDLAILESYIGYNMNVGLPLTTVASTTGTSPPVVSVSNGYTAYTSPFIQETGVTYSLIDVYGNSVLIGNTSSYVATDGVLTPDPTDIRLATFGSASGMFDTLLPPVGGYRVFINSPTIQQNYGAFNVIGNTDGYFTLQKVYLTGDVMGQLLRSDIDGDGYITFNDGYLLDTYLSSRHSPNSIIGTPFSVIRLRVESFIDRNDDYSYDPAARATTLHIAPDIFEDGYTYLGQHNFVASPAPISFTQELTWDASLVVSNSNPKQVPSVFTSETGAVSNSCGVPGITCESYEDPPAFDKGRVDVFVPDNLIIGDGDLVRPNGQFYKVDFEVGTVVLEIPAGLDGYEHTIDLLHDFVAEYVDGSGMTRLGFPAMRFSDCSVVSSNAIANNQVRFSVSVQSFSPNTFGASPGGLGDIVDGKMGVSIDNTTGLLTLNFTNLYQDIVLRTLNTKVQINAFLKRGGFNNRPLFVSSDQVQSMLS